MNLIPWREQKNKRINLLLSSIGIFGVMIISCIFMAAFFEMKRSERRLNKKIAVNEFMIKKIDRRNSNNAIKIAIENQQLWQEKLNMNRKNNQRIVNELSMFATQIPTDIRLDALQLQKNEMDISGASPNSEAIYKFIKNLQLALNNPGLSLVSLKQNKQLFLFYLTTKEKMNE